MKGVDRKVGALARLGGNLARGVEIQTGREGITVGCRRCDMRM